MFLIKSFILIPAYAYFPIVIHREHEVELGLLFLMVCVSLCGALSAFAAEAEVTDSTPYIIEDVISTKKDTKTYEFQIDHSVYPKVFVCSYTSGSVPGNSYITFKNENGELKSSAYLTAFQDSAGSQMNPKHYSSISDTSGEVRTYTMTVEAYTDNAGYTVIITPEDNIEKYLGGKEHAAIVGTNVQKYASTNYVMGYEILLNGAGDWYRYTPMSNGATYVGSRVEGSRSTAFEVQDAKTDEQFYHSSSQDQYINVGLSSVSTIMQNRLNLTVGKEYLIGYYAPVGISVENQTDTYRAFIGLPNTSSDTIQYTYPTAYTVRANQKTTIKIEITGQSDLARLYTTAGLSVSGGSNFNNVNITSCKITAPNGATFNAQYGKIAQIGTQTDLKDFLHNTSNIPINGLWTIEVVTRKTANLKFSINGLVLILNRNTVPQ